MFSLWFTLHFFYGTVILFTFPLPVSRELMTPCLIFCTCTFWILSFVLYFFFLKKLSSLSKSLWIPILFSNTPLAVVFFLSSLYSHSVCCQINNKQWAASDSGQTLKEPLSVFLYFDIGPFCYHFTGHSSNPMGFSIWTILPLLILEEHCQKKNQKTNKQTNKKTHF